MTNRIALFIGVSIILAIIFDRISYAGAAELFLARKTADMIDYIMFWR